MKLVLCYPAEEKHVQQIASVSTEIEIIDAGQERVADALFEAELYCGHAKVPVPWPEIVRGRRLKWIQSSAAGVDHCLTPEVIDSEIVVTSASGVLADQVAEQTFALLFGLVRSLPTFFRAQQQQEFIRRPTRDLHDTTILIIGFGGNGRRLAEVLLPFRPTLIATDYFPVDKPDFLTALESPENLGQLLPKADVVILTAPLTPQTKGMMNRETFSLMKPGSFLVNVARGQLVIEDDLVAALESGHLAGAGLDVTAEEPLPADSPLWELPNVIITPHVGGQSRWRIDRMTNFFCENLQRYLSGEPLMNVVDKQLGFIRRG